MLSALRHRNFRLYFTAQIVSNVGTWVQITVENWLVLQLSHSGLALGVTNALQFGPSVLLGMYGGVVADRRERRRLLIVTQTCLGLVALAVGLLAGIGIVRVWIIWVAAGMLGLVKCFDEPAIQSFVKDLVGPADLPNAVAWTNTIKATGRMVGPVLGGLVLTTLGTAPGFLVNAATFALVVIVLANLRQCELSPRTPVSRASGQIREGLIYAYTEPVLMATLVVMTVVFMAAYNFQISLALIASETLAGDSQTYGVLMSALGLGAAAGSLIFARHGRRPADDTGLDVCPCGDAGGRGFCAFRGPSARGYLCLWRECRPVQRHGDKHVAVADCGRYARPCDGAVFHLLPGKQPSGWPSLRCARWLDRCVGGTAHHSIYLRHDRTGCGNRLAASVAIHRTPNDGW